MSKVKFELNLPGLNELMKSSEMQTILEQYGSSAESAANGLSIVEGVKYSHSIWVGNYIAAAQIRAENSEAVYDNLENNTLLKAVRG